jgi:adenine-specific DNA-methyltransferase
MASVSLPPARPDAEQADSSVKPRHGREAEYGAIFTRRWIVELILDLIGYTSERDLASMRTIEPACGHGAFLAAIVERLSESCRSHGRDISEAGEALRACELQQEHVAESRRLVERCLLVDGWPTDEVRRLAQRWVRHEDFLLEAREQGTVDFVCGNPPYVRLESVPTARSDAYRQACTTMGGRSDIYVGFFETGLRALRPGGTLGFICADRWMRNQYGQRLRKMITDDFAVQAEIEMHDVDAFEQEVSAYPSIIVLRRAAQGTALVARARASFGERAARRVGSWVREPASEGASDPDIEAARLPGWFDGASSWPTGSPERLALLAHLERTLPALEDETTGTRVGIGVASGADQVFVTRAPIGVEPDRMLPLALVRDTAGGTLEWSGHHLVDPWDGDTGELVALGAYPGLRGYLERNATALRRRNVAGRRPQQWYRTIDRVNHTLTAKTKLLIPDIKAQMHPVLDPGGPNGLYPHHNLYWVTSEQWRAELLGGLLLSRVAQMFIECYAVKMRGGYFRFQAQYLRRIRVPSATSISLAIASELELAFAERDRERATAAALKAYRIEELPE